MPKNPHADFAPALEGYSGQGKFRFWCQMALPLTYDDSLSYYELLCKVVNYLNNTIEDVADVETNVSRLSDAYTQLQNYVNDYFDDLDVEAELRNVLDAMAEDGTLDDLLDPLVQNHLPSVVDEQIDDVVADQIDDAVAGQIDNVVAEQLPPLVEEGIPGEVSDWLTANVDPVGSAVVVDSSLTISGAAADAKVTGDELADLKTQLDDVNNALESVEDITGLNYNRRDYWEQGRYIIPNIGNTLEKANSTTRIRYKTGVSTENYKTLKLSVVSGWKYIYFILDASDKCTRLTTDWQTAEAIINFETTEKKIVLQLAKSDDSEITEDAYVNIGVLVYSYFYNDYNTTKTTAYTAEILAKRVLHFALPNNTKINITDTTIVIPSLTRIYFGNGITFRTSGATTISRIAVPDGTYSEELVVFNYGASSFRCVGGNSFASLSNDDIILFALSKGKNGCEIPASMYQYDGANIYAEKISGINEYNDITTYLDYIENSCNVAKGDTSTQPKNRSNLLSLLYFSDIHGQGENVQRILQFKDTYENFIFDIIHCGDSVTRNYEDANPFASYGGDVILNVIGNHDAWKTGATWPTPYNATETECYEKFIAPYISDWNVESAGVNHCYYYKDYTNGFRLIVIDSVHWDSAQKTWLINVLSSAKTNGLSVVIASHYPPESGITGFDCSFNSITQSINAVTPGENQMERLPDDAYDVVDDFITDNGKFVCWINGHTHDDFIGTVNNHTYQIAIVISCATTSNQYSDCARKMGTKTQDLFNVFTVDSTAKLIKLVRVGSDTDKFMRSRKTLCVNYDTKQIISNN